MFRDVLEITVSGGAGGDGCMSLLRRANYALGGPDGGDGGDGGSVVMVASGGVASLDSLLSRPHYKAGRGMNGEGNNRFGRAGRDLTLQVPVGTTIYGAQTGELLADLVVEGQQVVVARGGKGGRGNARFATPVRRTPRFAERGTPGESRRLRLELRLIADVGLVGYPNAGKSSLLAALSSAKPKIAAYPFTTLTPQLGVVRRGEQEFVLADLPGIIDGASQGKGLGLEFLRHISRTRLLVYVLALDASPNSDFAHLRQELKTYDPSLLSLPQLIALNKIDVADPAPAVEQLTRYGLAVLPLSARERQGLSELVDAVFALLPPRPQGLPPPQPRVVQARPTQVGRTGDGWQVTGDDLERVVSRFDYQNPEALGYLAEVFRHHGVYRLLHEAGVKPGETVRIGQAEFEYWPD